MDDASALKRLELLLKEDGALKIITPFHACALPDLVTDAQMAEHPSSNRADACRSYADEHGHVTGMAGGYRSPAHYHMVPVTRIEETDRPGWYTAYADDDGNTQCSGTPSALLRRLTEHEQD